MLDTDLYLVAVGLQGGNDLTDERLELIMSILKGMPGANEGELISVRKKLEANIGITMMAGDGLHGGEQEPWLEEVKASIKWDYWEAYKNQLKADGMSKEVIRVLDEDTDNILNECGNPRQDHGWKVRGLVMGDVQSGKTANYCGLVNKAADAGYKVIVLLTGMIEELRAQSQGRLDEGFVGRDSRDLLGGTRTTKTIGAGRFRTKTPNVLTSVDSDFLTGNARALGGIPLKNISEPVLLVMKKNKSALQNLAAFLDSQLVHGAKLLELPLLLIDDEADNASVNSRKDDDPTTINQLIRDVLGLFNQSTYTAYTATPFANVFINPDNDDLFPSNFVYSLNTPTNYIGATSVFSESGSHHYQLIDIDDAETIFPYDHKKHLPLETLPPSLHEAIQVFLLSCAIRDMRNEPLKHRSMLVNVTRLTDVQVRLSKLIKQYLYELTEEIKQYLADDNSWAKHPPLMELHRVWNVYYSDVTCSWNDIRKNLYESIASVKTLTINQKTEASDRLNYGAYKNSEKGRRVIAVGGLTLSRGLTLEGLCTSYFYRNSKAYDTLLQMGRWFGYRSNYDDLCRIWMEPNVQGWFAHIAKVVTELRIDIKRMHANHQPPEKFGMRVRSHPDTLIVTALNKMRNAQEISHSVSYSKYGAETPLLPKSQKLNQSNLSTVSQFIEKNLGAAERIGNRCVWSNIQSKDIASFLRKLNISNMNMAFISDLSGSDLPLFSFISQNTVEMLKEWDVCLPQGDGDFAPDLKTSFVDGTETNVRCRRRQFEKVPKGAEYLKVNRQRIGEISDEMVGLSATVITTAKNEWKILRESDPDNYGVTIPGYFYRRYRQRPLLTIHIIQPRDSIPAKSIDPKKRIRAMMRASEIDSTAIVAISISFPNYEDNESSLVSYRLNKVALRTLGLIEEELEDETDDQD
jgi:hypothetical protein